MVSRIMIAAPMSGSGKTTVTCGLLAALKKRGRNPVSFKCGPDYIDPMFHRRMLGVSSDNLDPYFLGQSDICHLLAEDAKRAGSDFALIEGVMGLYDGLGGVSEEASSYQLAVWTKTPIILVVRAGGIGRSLISLLRGFMDDDREGLIRGCILNQVSPSFYPRLKTLIEEELKLPVCGYLAKDRQIEIGSRHLGLMTPDSLSDLELKLTKLAEMAKESLDLAAIEKIAEQASLLNVGEKRSDCGNDRSGRDRQSYSDDGGELDKQNRGDSGNGLNQQKYSDGRDGQDRQKPKSREYAGKFFGLRVALAKDRAFSFIYPQNQRVLEEMGAQIIPFSPLHDKRLPENIDGLILSGGYPELYLKQLEDNYGMRTDIRRAISGGLPSIAECGGFLYLQELVSDPEGKSYRMCGLLPGKAWKTNRLVRFGYVELRGKKGSGFPGMERIRGHEFHYYDTSENGSDMLATKPLSGRSWSCAFSGPDHWWGFPHLYYASCPGFAANFLYAADLYHKRRMAEERNDD